MSALVIKLVACLTMLLDHIGYTWPALNVLRAPGRLAFPLFVFLMVEGFRHTSSRGRYALRLGIFALLSQIPFSLFLYGTPWHPKGSVLCTLLTSMLLLWQLDFFRSRGLHLLGLVLPAAAFVLCWRDVVSMDYGSTGILMALTIYYFGQRPLLLFFGLLFSIFHQILLSWVGTVVHLALGQKDVFVRVEGWNLYKLYAILSFGLMRAYDGSPGPRPASRLGRKAVQLGFYAFYPVHMLALWLLKSVIR